MLKKLADGCPRQSVRRWAVGAGQQWDAALMADLGWQNRWRIKLPTVCHSAQEIRHFMVLCWCCFTSYKLFIATNSLWDQRGLYLQHSNKWPPFYYSLNWQVLLPIPGFLFDRRPEAVHRKATLSRPFFESQSLLWRLTAQFFNHFFVNRQSL